MKILVIGSGGREHALVWKIAQSKRVNKIYCAPGNPGTGGVKLSHSSGVKVENVPIQTNELDKLVKFAKEKKIDLTVVGPEAPLIDGIVDLFTKNKLSIIGPSKKAAQIEGSKVFAKKLMKKYNIPTAKFEIFTDYNNALEYLRTHKYPLVVKADGQCLGKGVAVCRLFEESKKFLDLLMKDKIFGESGGRVVIEECLTGQEISFMLATDGKDFISLLPSQDHKPIFDGDRGPNTGGMGAYAPVPFVDKKLIKRIEEKIVIPTLTGMRKEGCPYRGILYPGLIITRDGPKVLEFNCRFGDPETQPLIMLLKTDIIDLFEAIINRKLKNYKLEWYKGAAVCVVLAATGYPGNYEKGATITLARRSLANGAVSVFHAGTKMIRGKLVTNGGRVLGVTARGKNLKEAMKNAYQFIEKKSVYFPGMHYRKDIGHRCTLSRLFVTRKIEMKVSYSKSGVDYNLLDPIKRLAQAAGLSTRNNSKRGGFRELSASRGESAYIIEGPDCYYALVEEGLGTKNLVADEMRKITGKTYYDVVAQDTVAAIINDLITVGAKPLSVLAYWAVGNSSWFEDQKRVKDLVEGWKKACNDADCNWGGGETPTLKDVINRQRIDLAGCAFGVIKPKKRSVMGDKLRAGDAIVFFQSSGIHANGLTLTRDIAQKLPEGFATKLSNGKMYGEELLKPTIIYSKLINELLDDGIDIHYMVNITGHGWRKLMRAKKSLCYVIDAVPTVPKIFNFIQKYSRLSDREMYATFNMGAGFAVMITQKDATKVLEIAKKHKISALVGGRVENGRKSVIIRPKKITYNANDLIIR